MFKSVAALPTYRVYLCMQEFVLAAMRILPTASEISQEYMGT